MNVTAPIFSMVLFIIIHSSISTADIDDAIDVDAPYLPIISYIILKSSAPSATVHQSALYPMYWEVNGKRELLLGGFDSGEPFLLTGSTLTSGLNTLINAGGNYLRNTMVDFTRTSSGKTGRLHPFAYSSSTGKFDLTSYNSTYWTQLDDMLTEAEDRGIVVSIELFDPWFMVDYSASDMKFWSQGPWSPQNNDQYTTVTSGLADVETAVGSPDTVNCHAFYKSIPAINNVTALLTYQQAFVDKLLTVTDTHANVIFQIDNESAAPVEWTDYWVAYLHSNAAGTVYVTDMRGERNLDLAEARHAINNPSLYDFADASQNEYTNTRDEQYLDLIEFRKAMIDSGHLRPINQVKVYSRYNANDTDSDLGIDRFFMDIFAGTAAVRFHQRPVGEGLSPGAKRAIKSARWLDDQVELASMVPIPLNDSRWIYRDDNEVYGMEGNNMFVFVYSSVVGTVYNPSGIKFDLRDDFSGYVQITWFNADTGEQHNGGTFDATSDWTPLYRPDRVSDTRWIAIVRAFIKQW